MVGWPGLAVGIWVENDRNYTTSLTCTNTPHSRVPRKQAHLHRGEGSVMDSPLNFWDATATHASPRMNEQV